MQQLAAISLSIYFAKKVAREMVPQSIYTNSLQMSSANYFSDFHILNSPCVRRKYASNMAAQVCARDDTSPHAYYSTEQWGLNGVLRNANTPRNTYTVYVVYEIARYTIPTNSRKRAAL